MPKSIFMPRRDKKFSRLQVCGFNARLPMKGFNLGGFFCAQEVRTVCNDLAISFNTRKFQIFPRAEDGNLRRKKVTVSYFLMARSGLSAKADIL
ncbi:MAG: hypothetical protein LBU12_09660 [Deltaproteobacteria bacterium]|jgi:hypothetical protein|nr:hypothetical protein [Deltaproteobacteria bacterium]